MPDLPTASVIVPTNERPVHLRACLEALAALDYGGREYEVVVVADSGSEDVESVVGEFRHRLPLQLLRQPNAGPGAARNAGAARAGGELLAFTDDDCRPRPDWLRRLAEQTVARPGEGVGGRTVNAVADNVYSEAAQLVIDVGYAQNNSGAASRRWFATNNLAVPADGFRAVGGFDPAYRTAEDRDFCARWTASGRTMSYEPRAVVEHARSLSLEAFARLHFRYGRGAFRFHRSQRRCWNRQPLIEPGYYAALAREPFRRNLGLRAVALEALLLVWHASNTAGFAWEALRARRR